MTENTHPLLLVVGLDGATFDLIEPMAARGELPTMARLMAEGAWGSLRSTTPPVSPQAWSSFLTGVRPGRHAIFGFQGPPEGRFYRRPILSSQDVQSPTVLDLLGRAGRRVGAFGVPMTYPPGPVNGVLVPEQQGPPLSYPPGVWRELVAQVGDPRDLAAHVPYLFTQDKRGYLAELQQALETQCRAAHWLLDREPFDLFVVVFTVADRAAHFLWKYADVTHPGYPPEWADSLGDGLPALYRQLDGVVGELWRRVGDEGTLIVLSDHGFGPLHRRFYVNRWLRQQGLLVERRLPYQLASRRYPWPLLRLFNAVARRVGLPHLALPIGSWRGPVDSRLYDPRLFFDPHLLIDWPRTRAYGGNGSEHGIFVNRQGREPSGTVPPGEPYEALRRHLRQALLAITDPLDGRPIVEQVWFREEIYQGPWVELAPDLVLGLRDYRYELATELYGPGIVGPALHRSGNHRLQGICLLAGPAVRPGAALQDAEIVDLAPTVLRLLGVEIPGHVEGRVLGEALEPAWREARSVSRPPGSQVDPPLPDEGLTVGEAGAVEARLRGLGYLG